MNNPIAAKLAEAAREYKDMSRKFPFHGSKEDLKLVDRATNKLDAALAEYDTAKVAEPTSPAMEQWTDQVRDGAFVFLDCARNYMAAVAHVFSTKDGKCLAELSPTKDQYCFDAFVRLNSTGKKLTQCCNKLDELVSVGPPQPPHVAPEAQDK